MNNHILVFAEDWGRHPSSTQHIIRHLAKNNHIIWVNSIGLRQPTLSVNDLIRLGQKLKSIFFIKKASLSHNHINDRASFPVVSLLTIPAPKTKLARLIATKLMLFQLRRILKDNQFNHLIVWTSLPTVVDLVGHLNEQKVIYYCGDDFSSLAGVDHDTVTKRENELVEKADIIFTVSLRLMSKFPDNKAIWLPHGVDYDLFSTPAKKNNWLHGRKKVAGFYGSISEWFNVELILNVAIQLPDWDFLLIGKKDIDIDVLTVLPNVYHLPAVSHQTLPTYSQYWTASLLPFRDNEQIQSCNPLKLREYLASGRPIVSTWHPALEPYKEFVFIANDAKTFVTSLIKASQVGDDYTRYLQKRVVHETWASRAALVAEKIALPQVE